VTTPAPQPQQQDWRPVPDPTKLTTEAVERATAQFRRELAALQLVIETRLDAMDKAADVLDAAVNRTPTAIQTAIASVKDVYDERFHSIQQQLSGRSAAVDERFHSIQQQFTERDVRTEQAATASASALAAALQAAKEAVFEQAQAAAKAAEKTELSTTKLLDQVQLQFRNLSDSFSGRIEELKERIDRGEGSQAGQAGQRNETRLNMTTVVSLAFLLLSLATFIILYVAKK
jgi:anti-sigma28 factor (negative regulator of flagellin synthesis)